MKNFCSSFVFLVLFSFLLSAGAQPVWTQLAPTNTLPAIRQGHTSVYDTTSNRLILFGGSTGNINTVPTQLNDLWVLLNADGTGGTPSWIQLSPTGVPSIRSYHASVYDSTNNRMIVFGGNPTVGYCNGGLQDVWVLSNANGLGGTPTWSQLSPTGGPPSPRNLHAAAYDAINNRLIISGGVNPCNSNVDDVWVLSNANGLGGSPVWTQLTIAGSTPTGRQGHSLHYDSANNRLILFAGYTSTAQTNDVWTLSNANGLGGSPAWTRLAPTGSLPLPRSYFGAHYDAFNNNLIVFGGSTSAGNTNDVWTLSNANGNGAPAWTRILPTGTLPSTRDTLASGYKPSNGRLMVFGGRNCTSTCVALNDSWALPLIIVTNPPGITSFNPASGVIGTSVSIVGSNLVGVTAVTFNGTSATFTNSSTTNITTSVPVGATTGFIAVVTTNGTATSSSNFVVNFPPAMTSFTPTIGSTGSIVTISGANLASVTNVQFNGTSATFSNATFSQITAVVPNGAVTGPIAVSSPYGIATSSNNFTVRTNALMMVGPLYPPPGGHTFIQSGSSGDGSISRASGKTWTFQNVQLANTAAVYWGTTNGGVRLSFLGPVYPNPSFPSEILTNSPTLTALSNGVVVWTGQTFLPGNGNPVYTRFTLRLKDASSNALPLVNPANLGLPASLGGLLQVTPGLSFQANLKFEASYSPSSGFQPALDFYDAQTTASGSAYSSFSGGFYYENTLPIFAGLSNQVVNMNVPVGPYPFTLDDTETGQNSLTIWATSTNQSLLFDFNILVDRFGGNSAQVRLYPNGGQSGKTLVTIFASDGYATNSGSFVLTVNAPPTISDITNKKVNKNAATGPINFLINDLETNPDSLVLSATSTNTSLVPASNIVFSATGTNRTVNITPSPNQIGTTLITITVSDGMATASDSFSLLVNNPPQLDYNLPLNLSQGASATINNSLLQASDIESTSTQLVYTVAAGGVGSAPHEGFLRLNGTNLIAGNTFTQDDLNNNRVTYLNGGSCATNDDFQFNVSDSDGGVTPTGAFTVFSFRIKIANINHAPVAVNGNASVGLGATIQNTFSAIDTDCPPVTLTFRILTNGIKGTATLTNASTGGFTYTANSGQTGTDTLVFQANDGALDSVSAGVFTVTITNQPPSATNGSGTTFENVALNGTLTASDSDQPPQPLTFGIATNGSKGSAVITNSSTGQFVYTPAAGAIGVDTFAFSVSDELLSSTGIFTVTIRANLDAGDVIVADQQKRIILIDPANGAQAIVSSNGLFGSPRSVALEPSGNLIVLDSNVGLIRIDPKTGAQSLLATNFSTAGFGAGGVTIEADGNILVADGGNGITRVDPITGVKSTVSSGGNLVIPFGITIGCNGDIYVSDVSGFAGQPSRVIRINPITGAQTLVSSGGNLFVPISLVLDGDDNIFVSDAATFAGGSYDLVTRIDPITGAQTVIATNNLFRVPSGIAFSTAQKLFTINQGSATLVQVDPANGAQTLISSNGLIAEPFSLVVVRATPAFTSTSLQGGSNARFFLSGETGRCIIVESSTNLINWSVYKTLSNPTGQTVLTETNAANSAARYFRARTR